MKKKPPFFFEFFLNLTLSLVETARLNVNREIFCVTVTAYDHVCKKARLDVNRVNPNNPNPIRHPTRPLITI